MVFLILFTGFLIRLISLNQSLWLDEAISANVVRFNSFWEIIKNFSPYDFHPPLYYLFLKAWSSFFGYSEISLRLPSVFFSLLTGYFLYLIGKNNFNKHIGFWAMIFFIFNPLIVYYSQEARMYLLATMFLIISLFYFLNLEKNVSNYNWQKKNFFLFNLFVVLSFYSFYGSIFLITGFFIYFLYKKQYQKFFLSFLIFLGSFLLITPLLYQQYLNSKNSLIEVRNWSLALGKANLKNFLLIPIKFSIGRISFYPKWLYWTLAVIWTSFLTGLLVFKKNKNQQLYQLFFLALFPLFLGFGISYFMPILQYFRFIYLIPIFCLIMAVKLRDINLKFFITLGFLVFSLVYLLNNSFHREDWKSLVNKLSKKDKIYVILSSSDPIKYYDENLKLYPLEELSNATEDTITVIPYVSEIWGIDYQKKLREKNYFQKNIISVRGLRVEIYEKR